MDSDTASKSISKICPGQAVSLLVYTTPIRNDAGEITHVMKMATDITEIKVLQNQLRDSRERYRQLFEEVPCYISIQDSDLQIVEANRRFREDFGDSMGQKCHQVYMHRTEPCVPCTVKQTFEDGQVHQSEEVVTSQRGEHVNVLVSAAPVRNTEGQIKNVIEMSTNITQIRQLQSQLASLGLVISSISHGIKGLLTSLDGGMYLVNTGLSKNDRKRFEQGWKMVERNVTRIRRMVLDLLYYAKDRDSGVGENVRSNRGGRSLRSDAGEGGGDGNRISVRIRSQRRGIRCGRQSRAFAPDQSG